MGLGNETGNGRVSGGLLGARPAEVVFDEASHWADGDRAYARSDNEIERDAVVRWIGCLQHTKACIEPVLGYLEPLTIGDVMGQPHPGEAPFMRLVKGDEKAAQQAFVARHAGMPPIKLGPVGGEYEREETPSVFERVVLGNTVMYIAFGVFCAAFVFCIMMLAGAGKADPYARVLPAIEQVESGGRSDAVGDDGKAVGILQIHPVTVEDANRIARLRKLNVSFTLADRTDAVKSRAMFRIVSDHYSLGKGDEVVARRWNGGPKGETKEATQQYWSKVKNAMK